MYIDVIFNLRASLTLWLVALASSQLPWINPFWMLFVSDSVFKGGFATFVKERLDRGVGNIAWREMFAEGFIQHLFRVKSDHCPMLCLY